MKTSFTLSSALLALLVMGLATRSTAAPWDTKLYMVVVADQADPAAKSLLPAAGQPVSYAAYDAGYIEAGDPIAGEKPPPASAISQALRAALASQNYLPAATPATPTLLLVYHWGLLNRDSYQVRSSFRLQPNLKARIALVAPKRYAERIEQDLIDRRQPLPLHIPIIDPEERELLQLVGDNRYFVIVSAYDFSSVTQGAGKLLWRVRLSTRSAGVSMAAALPTLIQGGGPYYGRNLKEMEIVRQPLTAEGGAAKGEEIPPPPQAARQIDEHYLRQLMRAERIEFSGIYPSDAKESDVPPLPKIAAAGTSFLPPALASRVDAYQHEKVALQDAVASRIKERTPGADARQAIDAFNQENAGRIAALTKEREAIRDELAKLAAANTDAAAGKSLNALLQEFSADVQKMD
ncbi:MAG TPA: hypothetical protein VLW52_05990 [Opitutaceae bacterium]|nr:hypothetical protein [Opitutaceae bacterium]